MFNHSISPLVARTVYTNDIGEQILFTQQVSEKQITGFSDIKGYTVEDIGARKTAVVIEGNRTTVYWHSDFYAYSITGMVAKDELVKMVQGIRFKSSDLPFKYNESIAKENGDIIADEITVNNVNRLKQFYSNFNKGIDDFIRIYEVKDDEIILSTAKISNRGVYYTRDTRRSNYGEHVFEDGMRFDEVLLTEARGGKQSIILRSGNQQITLISF